jgi:hypothetical protein
MWLDEVPRAEDQQAYREAVVQKDMETVKRFRRSAHRFLALKREEYELTTLVGRAIFSWMDEHQWREAGFGSRLEFDRALNAAGSVIRLNRDETERVQSWIQEEGVTREEAQARILDEREAGE